ncbi:unnamed protein product [Medioppia subpectinata]|uniref:Uncharacterized protein n=1 Tax=Medioppia subpectinata TaxID=1979941 RepID=A0A7R9KER4_9ACAR|nr:unnamed protein product [Medioppia subpectinata]CAG2101986.1 unnamed protein product [Medioppia subpectinata]
MQSLLFLITSLLMISSITSFIKIDAIVDTKFSPKLDGEAINCDLCGDTCVKSCTDSNTARGLESFRRCCASYFKKRTTIPAVWPNMNVYRQLVSQAIKQNMKTEQN